MVALFWSRYRRSCFPEGVALLLYLNTKYYPNFAQRARKTYNSKVKADGGRSGQRRGLGVGPSSYIPTHKGPYVDDDAFRYILYRRQCCWLSDPESSIHSESI